MSKYWGLDLASALTLDCNNPHGNGHPLVHNAGLVRGMQLDSRGLADDSVIGRHIKGLSSLLVGFPIDGKFDANGTNNGTNFGLGAAGSTYIMTRDVNFSQLIIRDGVRLKTGYRVFAEYLKLEGSAKIDNDGGGGGDGGNAAGAVGGGAGSFGTASVSGSISYTSINGSTGGVGSSAGVGGNSGGGTSLNPVVGGNGGKGSDGQAGVSAGGTGSAVGAGTPTTDSIMGWPNAIRFFDHIQLKGIAGSTSGTGGGGGGFGTAAGANGGGGGGGGGASGGVCIVCCDTLDITGWNGRISALGGDGGGGGTHAGNGGDGGKGGPGAGGAAVLVCRRVIGGVITTFNTESIYLRSVKTPSPKLVKGYTLPPACLVANPGAFSTLGFDGNASTPADGYVVFINLSNPFVQSNEYGDVVPHAPNRPQIFNPQIRHRRNF